MLIAWTLVSYFGFQESATLHFLGLTQQEGSCINYTSPQNLDNPNLELCSLILTLFILPATILMDSHCLFKDQFPN